MSNGENGRCIARRFNAGMDATVLHAGFQPGYALGLKPRIRGGESPVPDVETPGYASRLKPRNCQFSIANCQLKYPQFWNFLWVFRKFLWVFWRGLWVFWLTFAKTEEMKDSEQRRAARRFAEKWKGRGYEKGEAQTFWYVLLRDVLGVEKPEEIVKFEEPVKIGNTQRYVDVYIKPTKVLIEQKSSNKDLRVAEHVSGKALNLSAFGQAKMYANALRHSLHPRWIVTCNFRSFLVYDMEFPNNPPEEILLENLENEVYRLRFLVDDTDWRIRKETQVSLQAGDIVSRLHDAILRQYIDPENPATLHSLNVLCVRLVFCLYAEDAGVFGRRGLFHDYLAQFLPERMRSALIELFKVLNTPAGQRDPYMEDNLLAAFPYVNGGLFATENVEIPSFNAEIADLLLRHASDDFDWSRISPTIFGAIFESTLNPATRREDGAHFTSIENIHRVIDPLFLDSLKRKFKTISRTKEARTRRRCLSEFQRYLASLRFFDPACGSGNFLTETYLALRRLENECLRLLGSEGQIELGKDFSPILVSIKQFYGIEVNDFAVSVARTALWIAEAQMMAETERIVGHDLDYFPLKSYPNIVEGNALRMDWNEVCPASGIHYIMGNPPFVGARMMKQGSEQKKEIQDLFGRIKDVQDLDYVCGWYKKAAEYMQGTRIETAFVSTNSVSQGSQVPILWGELFKRGIHINFAYRTFKWNSEATEKAAVHCVIIGFATFSRNEKVLYNIKGEEQKATNISPYLTPGANTLVVAHTKPLCNVPRMSFGNQPRDGGHFVVSAEERTALLKASPDIAKWLRPYIGAEEFINRRERWCFWLKEATPADIKQNKILYERVTAVREFRLASSAKTTNGYAKVPHLFAQITQPDGVDYLLIPRVSSERRLYVPIGFMNAGTIASDAVQIIPNATLYHFGILTSSVHMAWMRMVCGRLKSDYRYSKDIVYNNFPWPKPIHRHHQRIEQAAQGILDARALYPDSSLAALYDKNTMPTELYEAHQRNDRAVKAAYGFPAGMTEEEVVEQLLGMYEALLGISEEQTTLYHPDGCTPPDDEVESHLD